MSGKNISRAPNLSAIEEGGTITSIGQILDDTPPTPDVIEEGVYSEGHEETSEEKEHTE